jgi:serine/threonine protein kinase
MSVHLETTTALQGKRIGSYRLTRPLGHGGSGHVFLGTHVQLGHHVAVKVVGRPSSDAALKQLWNEARILPRLHHPNIVRMLDFNSDGTYSFLIMELALHGTMRHRYPVGSRLSLPAIAYHVRQVAAALQYTHTFGYIHRDVKPENLLLTQDEHILLSDFGIATTTYYADRLHDRFGTAPYTAPEQAHGNPCAASDQYSLAVVVYEWLCGHTPFAGTTREVLLQHHMATPPSLASQGRAVPQAVEQVVQIALAKDPADRFESIRQFAQALTWAMRQPMKPVPIAAQVQVQPPSRLRADSRAVPHTERTVFSHPVTQACGQTERQQTVQKNRLHISYASLSANRF